MITGRQIRVARELLDWSVQNLAERAKVPPGVVEHAEGASGAPTVTLAQALKLQSVLEAAGVRFNRNDGAVIPP
jgi:ribosome-binding protein aMBF1 (putative translation factor)